MRTIIIILLLISDDVLSQTLEQCRSERQHYYEDSTSVFWVDLPNPFAPPTVIGYSSKACYCGIYNFYCILSDTVTVAFQTLADSTLYSLVVVSRKSDVFHLCLCIAGSLISIKELPNNYYQTNGNEKIRIVLIVEGRRKCCLETMIGVRNYLEENLGYNRYYWFKDF